MGTLIRYQGNTADVANRTAVAAESLATLSAAETRSFETVAYASDGRQYRYVAEVNRAGTLTERWVEVGNPANTLTARPAGWLGKATNLPAGAALGTIRYRAVADVDTTVSIGDIIHASWVLNGANEPTRFIVNATKSTTLSAMPTAAALVEATVPSSVLSLGQTWTDGAGTPSLYVLRDIGTAQSFIKVKGPGAATLPDATTLSLVTGATTVNTTFPAETAITYRTTAAGTGYALGDIVLRVLWVARDTPGSINGTFWFNATTGQMLASAPSTSNLSVVTVGSSSGGGGAGGEVVITFNGLPLGINNRLPVATGNLRVGDADVTAANAVPSALVHGTGLVDRSNPLPVLPIHVSAPTTEIDLQVTTAVAGGFLHTIPADPLRKRGWVTNNGQVTIMVRESMTPANVATATVGAQLAPGGTWVIETTGTVSFFVPETNSTRLYGLLWSGA